jgi:hypothetical protein
MEVSGQLHASAATHPAKDLSLFIGQESEWALRLVWSHPNTILASPPWCCKWIIFKGFPKQNTVRIPLSPRTAYLTRPYFTTLTTLLYLHESHGFSSCTTTSSLLHFLSVQTFPPQHTASKHLPNTIRLVTSILTTSPPSD